MHESTRRELVFSLAALGGLARDDKPNRRQMAAADVNSMMQREQLSRHELMLKLLPEAQSHARVAISNYRVGAVASGTSGNFYFGQNIEIPGNPLGLAVHAEQSAIANAYMAGEEGIDAIAIKGSPCGHCRQFLSEVSTDISMRILTPNQPEQKLSDLLPNAFGPKNLGFQQGVLPARRQQLTLATASSDELVHEALKAACQAYAPYSRSPSGVALSNGDLEAFSGSYIENAAFNPSLPPLQAALAGYFAAAKDTRKIARCVLVEGKNSAISQFATSQITLAAFADVRLERFVF